MSWEIQQSEGCVVVMLGENLSIQDASAFHEALLGHIKDVQHVKINAAKVKELHTSIFQVLTALSKSVQEFELVEAGEKFCEIEKRMGYKLARKCKQATKD